MVSPLIDMCRKLFKLDPEFQVIDVKGMPHARTFTVGVKLKQYTIEEGTGTSKKKPGMKQLKLQFKSWWTLRMK